MVSDKEIEVLKQIVGLTVEYPKELFVTIQQLESVLDNLQFEKDRADKAEKKTKDLLRERDCRSGTEKCHIAEELGFPCYRRLHHALEAERDKIVKLQKIIDEVHSCAIGVIISSDEDMMQNIDRIVEITTPKYER